MSVGFIQRVRLIAALRKVVASQEMERLAAWINQEVNEFEGFRVTQIGDLFSPEIITFVKSLNAKPPSTTLYRGLYWPSLDDALHVSNAVLKQPPKIGQILTYKDKTPSSWSISQDVAEGFSTGGDFGITIKAIFPLTDIICYIPALASKLKDLVNKERKEDLIREKEVIVEKGIRKVTIVNIYDLDINANHVTAKTRKTDHVKITSPTN